MRSLMIAAVAALAFSGVASAAVDSYMVFKPDAQGHCRDQHGKFAPASKCAPAKPHCTTGVPCGNTCIAKGKVCHK